MTRRILFIQNPGNDKVLQQGVPLTIEQYKNFFRSEVGGWWSDSEFLDVERMQPNSVTIQSDFIAKLMDISAVDVDYSIVISVGHGAAIRIF